MKTDKIEIKGYVQKIEEITMNTDLAYLKKIVLPHMNLDDISYVLRMLLEKQFKENDPSIKDCDIDWYNKTFEKFSFVDYHKNEEVYDTVRKFSQEENDTVLALEAIMSVFK